MSWLFFAFAGPIAWAISTHIDKYLVEKYFKHSATAVLMVFTAAIGLLMLPFIAGFDPGVLSLPFREVVVMMASGVLYMAAMLFYLQALQGEEASVVALMFQASAIWGFVLAYFVLGEKLGIVQAAGGVLIVGGTAALSIGRGERRRKTRFRPVARMLACTFALALSSVIFKAFAVRDEFWRTTFWTYAGEALFGAAILAIPRYLAQFLRLLRTKREAVLAINGANELINLGGGLAVRFAFLAAPLALVQAISSTTTLFVFAFGILLTLFFPRFGEEDLSRRNLVLKGIAAAIVAAGVFLVQSQRTSVG